MKAVVLVLQVSPAGHCVEAVQAAVTVVEQVPVVTGGTGAVVTTSTPYRPIGTWSDGSVPVS